MIREIHLRKADRWLRRGHASGRGGLAGETRLRKRTGGRWRLFLLPPGEIAGEIAGLLHDYDVVGVGCGRHARSRCNRPLLYPLRENLYLLPQRLDLFLALLQLALILLQLAWRVARGNLTPARS